MLVGSPPGGGYDLYARLIAPHLAAKMQATVLVENKAGSGGLAAVSAMLLRPEDGLTIMHASAEAAIISQMLARPGVTWDVTKLHWLAGPPWRRNCGTSVPTPATPRSRTSPGRTR